MKHLVRPHFKSTFIRYYSLILALVFILLTLFASYIYLLSAKNFSTQQDLAEKSLLNQSMENIDNSFYLISQMAATTTSNKDLATLSIFPSLENPQRNFSIITALKSMVENNNYISKSYLYEHTRGYLFTSESDITSLDGYADAAAIHYCLSPKNNIILQQDSNRSCSRLVQNGRNLYFVYDFIYSTKGVLNSLILELNPDTLFYDFFQLPSFDNYYITIRGNKPLELFSNCPEDSLLTDTPVMSTLSSYTHFSYDMYKRSRTPFPFLSFEKNFLPFFLCILCISLALAYFITRKTYAPIKKLTQMVRPEESNSRNISFNAFDYLEKAYQKLIIDNKSASVLLENVQSELEQKLFTNILNGTEYSDDDLKHQLRTLRSVFRADDKYQIILFHFLSTVGDDVLALHIYAKRLEQLCSQLFLPEWGNCCFLFKNDRSNVLVIQYPASFSIARIKQINHRFLSDMD